MAHWAVADIKTAFEQYPEADMGLIISTASTSTKLLDKAIEKLREETGKYVSLLIGKDVCQFCATFLELTLGRTVRRTVLQNCQKCFEMPTKRGFL